MAQPLLKDYPRLSEHVAKDPSRFQSARDLSSIGDILRNAFLHEIRKSADQRKHGYTFKFAYTSLQFGG